MSVDVAAIRKAPVGRVATLSADLFNGPDPVPGIEVELPLEQVKASAIGADVALVSPADLAALCDEVDALRAAVALHRPDPEPVEIETFCDGCDPWIEGLGCNGHFRDVLTCRECGAANVDGELGYREWPCSTVRAAGLDGEATG